MNMWINYFLQKCIDQAMKHIKYFQDLETIHKEVSKLVKENIRSSKNIELIDTLFNFPQLTVTKMAEEMNVSKGQAIRYLKMLENLGILYADQKKRNTSYYFEAYLKLLV